MNLLECIRIAFYNLWLRKVRSVLNMIGVGIGVASITLIVSLGEGGRAKINEQIEKLGSDLIWVYPFREYKALQKEGGEEGKPLFIIQEDIDAITTLCSDVIAAAPENQVASQTKFLQSSIDSIVSGITTDYKTVKHFEIEGGRFLTPNDVKQISQICVIEDSKPMRDLFGLSQPLGNSVIIFDTEFTVVGIVRQKGIEFGKDRDLRVYIPISTWGKMTGRKDITLAYFRVRDAATVKKTAEKIRTILAQRYGTRQSFKVMIATEIMEFALNTANMLTFTFGGVGMIALIVGGIGIMNTMLATVTERTREIGIVKAEGARNSDILKQFLIEAVLLTSLGGVAGIVLGIAGNFMIAPFAQLPVIISYGAIVIGLLFSIGTGVASGLYPANRAAKLDPIEALRYQ